MSRVPYANVIGSLMYVMVCTRPDISHVVGVVSRYIHNPRKDHWQAVKQILRYIHNTVDVGLVFEQKGSQYLIGYCDSHYSDDLDKRRSITSYAFTIANASVSWKSTLQSTVALSTTKAEYMAITEAAKEAIWLKAYLESLVLDKKESQYFVTIRVLFNYQRTKFIMQERSTLTSDIISYETSQMMVES